MAQILTLHQSPVRNPETSLPKTFRVREIKSSSTGAEVEGQEATSLKEEYPLTRSGTTSSQGVPVILKRVTTGNKTPGRSTSTT